MRLLSNITNRFKPAIKLYWWRLYEDQPKPGNFGDEITKEIIQAIFKRKVEWAPVEHCELIGAGSIIEEVTENKGANRPYLWGSGFIQPGSLTISSADYKIKGVRGTESLARVTDDTSHIVLGDPGILASYLLKKRPTKTYKLGILAHYVDKDHPFVENRSKSDATVRVIDPTWPCTTVVEEIAKCDAVLSSSLHGLIVADSVGTPNLHLKLGDGLKGGSYKFGDYYSIYNESRYQPATPADLEHFTTTDEIVEHIHAIYKPVDSTELQAIKDRIIKAFPFR